MHISSEVHLNLYQFDDYLGEYSPVDVSYDVTQLLEKLLAKNTNTTPIAAPEPVKEDNSLIDVIINSAACGFVTGALKNAAEYAVEFGKYSGRVRIYSKKFRTSESNFYDNPGWLVNVDVARRRSGPFHINVNPDLVVLPNPNMQISLEMAKFAGTAGEWLNTFNEGTEFMLSMMCYYQLFKIALCVRKDWNTGSLRNTIRKIIVLRATTCIAMGGSDIGAVIGTRIFPGIGAMIGILVGGTIGGIVGGICIEKVVDRVLDFVRLNVYSADCEKCGQKFECRRYEEGCQEKCKKCRNEKMY